MLKRVIGVANRPNRQTLILHHRTLSSDDAQKTFAPPHNRADSMRILQLNHVALHVTDVARSIPFYRDVLRLPVLDRPAFSFPGAWFRVGVDQELHLIGDRDAAVHSHPRGTHLALEVDDLDTWESHL